jgi:RNA polymerase sigma-70 factor, ECF subfamily
MVAHRLVPAGWTAPRHGAAGRPRQAPAPALAYQQDDCKAEQHSRLTVSGFAYIGTVTTYRDDTQARAQPDGQELEAYRRELTGYCYRMLGSGFEADDAVQETMVRAWRSIDGFEGRSALRSWLYRIATNVCIDMLKGPQRRALPMDLGPSSTAAAVIPDALPEASWVLPVPDARVSPAGGDPAELTAYRESIRFAFVVALQYLPPRQRAILILRDVLRWQASEVAELLATTAVSVNSALQRARASVGAAGVSIDAGQPAGLDAGQQDLLNRYVDAFERYDVTEFVSLLHADATFSMPPHPMWLRGPAEVSRWLLGQGLGCRGSRLVATAANGCAAFGSYRPAGPGAHEPFAIQVVEISGGRIAAVHNFLYPELFAAFGLPARLEG